ncbi:IQ domain-containing protein E isoform 2-T2 [Thomomys bottae]
MAESAASGRRGRVPAVSLGTEEPVSETGDDSLSAITFDSDTELKTERKVSHKPLSTSPKSPYYTKARKMTSWRSLRTAGAMPLSSRLSQTPQKLWLGAAKQGHPPGITIYREKEDMYDEITELKKLLHMQKNDVDLMRTKLRRLEEENNRKDRQIEQLLDPGRGSDFIRTLADKRPDSGWVITGLKQRIFRLEQQCKEKDGTISKLQADMKTTNLEEMRIAMETYDEEIHRLQTLLASSEATGKKPLMEKPGLRRQRKMSSALLNLSRSVQELTEENQSLKEDLDRVLSNSPTVSKTKSYADWSKPRLLRRIAELERKLTSQESSKLPSAELTRLNPLPPSISSTSMHKLPKPPAPPVPTPPPPPPEEPEPLQEAVRELRQERSWLRGQLLEFEVEVKQLLHTKASLEQELRKAREDEQERQEREKALQEEIQTLTRKCKELEEAKIEEADVPLDVAPIEVASVDEAPIDLSPVDLSPVDLSPVDLSPVDEAPMALTPEYVSSVDTAPVDLAPVDLVPEEPAPLHFLQDPDELRTPSPCSEHSHPDLELDSCSEEGQEGCLESLSPDPIPSPCCDRREVAARTLQAWWKARQQQRRQAILDEATVVLQVAFRGHLARSRLLASPIHHSTSPPMPALQDQSSPEPRVPSPAPQTEASPGQEEAVTIIQSVLRGHLARDRYSATNKGTATTSPRRADPATFPEATSPSPLESSPDKEQSEASSGEATEDEPQPRPGEMLGPQLHSAEPCPPDPKLASPLPVDDSTSDDSDDDIIIAPSLPMKNNPFPF